MHYTINAVLRNKMREVYQLVYTQKQIKFDSDHDGCTGTIVHYISAIYGVWGLTTFADGGSRTKILIQ